MKLLLDECVTRFLRRDMPGHDVDTVEDAGFKGLENGALLQAAAERYQVLITVDRNILHQQRLPQRDIAIVILAAKKNSYMYLKPLLPSVLEALQTIQAGDVVFIEK